MEKLKGQLKIEKIKYMKYNRSLKFKLTIRQSEVYEQICEVRCAKYK